MDILSFNQVVDEYYQKCQEAQMSYEKQPIGILVDYINKQGMRNKFLIRNIYDAPWSIYYVMADCVSNYRIDKNYDEYGIDDPDFAITKTLTIHIDNIQSATICYF